MTLIVPIFIVIIGLVFGSFVTMASWRLPREEEMVKTPSHCPNCTTPLTFKDLWPLLSWAVARGKCRHCGVKMSLRYPLTEMATAAMFLLVYAQYGVSPLAAILALLGVALLVMIVVDFEHYIIPDEVHWFLLPLGVAFHYVKGTPPLDAALGFGAMGGLGLLLHYGYAWLRKKDGLGFGDVKFFAVAGLWLTLMPIPMFLFLSGLLGVMTGLVWRALGLGPLFPFGPALAVSLFLCALYPELGNSLYHIEQFIK